MIDWAVVRTMCDHEPGMKEMFNNWIIPQLESQPEEGLALEIGVRRGGTSFALMQAIASSSNPKRPLFGVDPWGNLPYAVGERIEQPNYGEQFYQDAMISLSILAKELNIFHHIMRLKSTDFIKIFDQVDFYRDGKALAKQFSLIYLDGCHDEENVSLELEYFVHKMMPGGMIIVDDTHELANSKHPTISWMFAEGETVGQYIPTYGQGNVFATRTMLKID